jgi:hypothetical protein
MNKAFTREIEERGGYCPACGALGTDVLQATLVAHVPAAAREHLADSAWFCSHPTCDVAYFDRFDRTVATDILAQPVFPKDPEAPICPCFGLTCEDIEADVQEGVVTRVKAHLEQANSSDARCVTKSASGHSCIPAVQRHFMQLRGQ